MKDLLKQAERAASKGNEKDALVLYESCIRQFMKKEMPFRALAAAKTARTVLGPLPKVAAILIRLYGSMGLVGDARHEFNACSGSLKKDMISLFKDLTMEDFTFFLAIMEILSVPKGKSVIRQNDTGEDIFVILSGCCAVIRDSVQISTLEQGDIFGELGFFHHEKRSTTIKSLMDSKIIQIPAVELRRLSDNHAGIKKSLLALYHERFLKKACEDLASWSLVDLHRDDIQKIHFSKGQKIPCENTWDISIVKHGVVEIDYNEKGPAQKRFLKPGSIIRPFLGVARANTDVDLVCARINLLGEKE